MKYSLTERLLLFLAEYEDFIKISRSVTLTLRSFAGDPYVRKNHNWMVSYLESKKGELKLKNAFFL